MRFGDWRGWIEGRFWVGRHQKSGRVGCYAPTLNLSRFVNVRAMVGSAQPTMDGWGGLKKGGVFRLFCICGCVSVYLGGYLGFVLGVAAAVGNDALQLLFRRRRG